MLKKEDISMMPMKFPFEQRKYEILERTKATTNPEFGKKPEERSIKELLDTGLVLINKPQGPTSHQVADYLKNILELDKVGHSGSLDPHVFGLLVITLGKATRSAEYLLKGGKEYICLMHIHTPIEEKVIRDKFNAFLGKIQQLPPLKSAVKRQVRTREIYYLEILEIEGQDVLFKVGCEAGTYIRTICHDFGKSLNTKAHMQELVRTRVCSFSYKDWITLHDAKDAFEYHKDGNETKLKEIIHPYEKALSHIKKIYLHDNAVDTICHGAFLSVPGIVKLDSDIEVNDTVALFTLKNELVAVGKAKMNSQNMLKQEKGIAVTDNKVFMEPNTYPKFKKNI
jgi:H/ACA ribonucleoprotein complex subunit 4